MRAWNVVAVFRSGADARRACAALRGARLRQSAITAGKTDSAGEVHLRGFASDRTINGGLAGALAGLFLGGFVAAFVGSVSSPAEVLAALTFGVAGGGAVGGMVAGASNTGVEDGLDAVLDRLAESDLVHVAVHCSDGDDAILAARLLAGIGPADLYCLGVGGRIIW